MNRYIAATAALDPVEATRLGIDGLDHALPDLTHDGIMRAQAATDDWLTQFEAISDEGLSPDDQIDRDLVLSHLRGLLVMRDWNSWRRNPTVYALPPLEGVFTLLLHRSLPEAELIEAVCARLRGAAAVLDAGIANLDPALASPIFVDRAADACRAAIDYCRTLVPAELGGNAALVEAGEAAARAYESFGAFLIELRATASGAYAIGAERYSALLEQKEMLGYDVHEMLARGRAAYEELSAELSRRAHVMRGTDDWAKVIQELSEDHPATPEAMRDEYEAWTARARTFLVERELVTLPIGERCVVEPAPTFQRAISAVAFYDSPQMFKASNTGYFFVPVPPDGASEEEITKRLASNSFSMIPTVSVHEAYPGHHWHFVQMLGARPIRKVLGSSYFIEGWGLYSEIMMMEQGFYDDPRHELGVLDARIFRAARIIVDTSLHTGAMDFEQAVDFMVATGVAEPMARAEVARYCSWPTQASSYFTGSLEIERMRARWFAEGRGDLRAFHDRITASGALPIALCERAVFG